MLYDATVDDEGVIGRRRCIDDNSRVIDAPIMLMDGACFDCHFSDGRSGQAVSTSTPVLPNIIEWSSSN